MATTPRRRKAATKTPISPVAERVVETRTRAPEVASTRVLDASMDYAWLVGCEHASCTHKVLVSKYDYRPVDFTDPDGPMIKIIYTAPGRRRCGLHVG